MRLDELGEFGLIARLTQESATRPDVLLGVGDDAAVLDPGPDMLLVATVDAQVAGLHFLLGDATPEEIGHKALAVNLSDIAAMGAEPLWALVSLLVSADVSVDLLDGVYRGMRALGERFGTVIVGGNVTGTEGPFTLDVTLLGRTRRGRVVTRGGGQPGDALLVTGTLGLASAGVLLVTSTVRPTDISADVLERARRAKAVPWPRVAEGRALADAGVVAAMLDLSDGLTGDLAHLCERSGVGAELDAAALPVNADAAVVAAAFGLTGLDLALHGGEDYELLFAVRPSDVGRAVETVRAVAGVEAHVVGRLTAEPGLRLRRTDGQVAPLEPRGWDHLRHGDGPLIQHADDAP